MQVESMMLCHSAINQGGMLSVLGAFDTLRTPSVPYTQPTCTVAIRLRFESLEAGEHRTIVKIVDADGTHLRPPIVGLINVAMPIGQNSIVLNQIANFHQSLTFEKYGDYAINLEVDGEHVGSLPISVQQPQ